MVGIKGQRGNPRPNMIMGVPIDAEIRTFLDHRKIKDGYEFHTLIAWLIFRELKNYKQDFLDCGLTEEFYNEMIAKWGRTEIQVKNQESSNKAFTEELKKRGLDPKISREDLELLAQYDDNHKPKVEDESISNTNEEQIEVKPEPVIEKPIPIVLPSLEEQLQQRKRNREYLKTLDGNVAGDAMKLIDKELAELEAKLEAKRII